MKLEANIKPRRDGTIKATFGAVEYVFAADEEGRLIADVGVDEHIAELLNSGNFIPADEEDFQMAAALSAPQDDDDDDGDDEEEMQGGTEVDQESTPAAPPIEENTPRSLRKPRKAK